ncbi:unnamed protein product [Pylaiella littoralis]
MWVIEPIKQVSEWASYYSTSVFWSRSLQAGGLFRHSSKPASGKGTEFRKQAKAEGLKLLAFFAVVRFAHYAMNRPR